MKEKRIAGWLDYRTHLEASCHPAINERIVNNMKAAEMSAVSGLKARIIEVSESS